VQTNVPEGTTTTSARFRAGREGKNPAHQNWFYSYRSQPVVQIGYVTGKRSTKGETAVTLTEATHPRTPQPSDQDYLWLLRPTFQSSLEHR